MSKPKDLSKVGPGPEKQSNRLALALVSKEHHVDARVGSSVSHLLAGKDQLQCRFSSPAVGSLSVSDWIEISLSSFKKNRFGDAVQLARKAFLRLRAIGKGAEGRGIISRWKPCRRLFLEYLRESYVHSPIDVFGIVDLHATIRNDLARLGDNKLDLIFAFCPVSFHIPVFSRSPYFLKAAPFRPFLVGNPNHLLRQALLLFLHCFRLMAIMPLPALLTSSTRLPAQTQTHKPRLLFRVVFFRVLCSLQTPDSFIYSLGFSLVRLLISSSVVVDSLLPQHSSIGGVGKGHSTTGKDVDAIHFSSSEFKAFKPYLGPPYYELWAQGRGDEQTEALTRYGFGFQLALVSFVPFSLDSRPHFARLSQNVLASGYKASKVGAFL
ncbi:hypothetical protein Q3G72_021572 [Acer saccharum]|nr:hypothetical protein Q3G72_021572 [Acer saccharum]